jgi:DNA-binding phage protein
MIAIANPNTSWLIKQLLPRGRQCLTMRMGTGSMMNMASFSDQVRQAIDQCGMTRYAIAKATGLTEGALSRFMSGERDMTLRTLERIAPLIGVRLVVHQPKRRRKGQ